MTQQQAPSTISPVSIGIGALALADVATELAALLTFVYGRRPHVHVNVGMLFLNAGFRPPFDVYFSSTSGWRTLVSTRIWINVDTVNVLVFVEGFFAVAGDQGQVRFTIGGVSTTITADDTDNGAELAASLATSATGTGYRYLTIEMQRSNGTGLAYLANYSVHDERIVSGFPDPTDD